MPEEIIIKLNEEMSVPGKHPIVIIGPNGSGKTRYGVELARLNHAEFVGAVRNIVLPENIQMQGLDQANRELSDVINRHRSRYWQMANEINQLFAKLLAEDATSAIRFRDRHAARETAELEETNLMRLKTAWTDFFPGRDIDFSTHKPTVGSEYDPSGSRYSASKLSDGERVALYLGGRILNAQTNTIVVDEPEVHFHSRLAIRFWNTLERFRPDMRFIYITHDLTFALSREFAQFLIVQPNAPPKLIPFDAEIPKGLAESILGAASFSIYAKRIVFCEGKEGEGSDYSFYSNWFKGFDTAVIPVGSCKDVVRCTETFGNERIVAGVLSIGIVDRDYWPDQYLETLSSSVFALPVHEVENLFCLRSIFEATARHIGLNTTKAAEGYNEFLSKAKARFTGGLLAQQISERFKRRCQSGVDAVVNGLRVPEDTKMLETKYVSALQPENWNFDPQSIFLEEQNRLEKALSSDENDFLKLFPGKVLLPIAANVLGIDKVKYRELIGAALLAADDGDLSGLHDELEEALLEYLPPREIDSASQGGGGDDAINCNP